MQKLLIIAGIVLLLAGIAWPWLGLLPLGRLPGDIVVEKQNVKIYFPITTMVLVSALISLIVWLFRQ